MTDMKKILVSGVLALGVTFGSVAAADAAPKPKPVQAKVVDGPAKSGGTITIQRAIDWQ